MRVHIVVMRRKAFNYSSFQHHLVHLLLCVQLSSVDYNCSVSAVMTTTDKIDKVLQSSGVCKMQRLMQIVSERLAYCRLLYARFDMERQDATVLWLPVIRFMMAISILCWLWCIAFWLSTVLWWCQWLHLCMHAVKQFKVSDFKPQCIDLHVIIIIFSSRMIAVEFQTY